MVKSYLGEFGFCVTAAHSGGAGIALYRRERFDALILDLMLPDMDGLEVCRQIRADARARILMLTARGDAMDRIVGLEMGADDYLAKPFEPRELMARIRSVLRRTEALPPNLKASEATRMQFAGWTLDLTARHLINPEGVIVVLSGAEFRLLKVF